MTPTRPVGETIFWQGSPVPDPTIKPDQDPPKLPQLTQQASAVLYSLSSVFPFDLFPDKIIIRLNHIDVVHGIFFWSGTTDRIQVIDIRDVSVQYNPFFGRLKIIPVGTPDNTLSVKFLWRHQALRAKRIILGLLECHRQHVNLSKYSRQQLLAYVEKIGRAATG